MEKRFYSIKESAAFSGLSQRYLYKLVSERKIRSFRIGKRIVLEIGDLEDFIQQGVVEAVDWQEKARELEK